MSSTQKIPTRQVSSTPSTVQGRPLGERSDLPVRKVTQVGAFDQEPLCWVPGRRTEPRLDLMFVPEEDVGDHAPSCGGHSLVPDAESPRCGPSSLRAAHPVPHYRLG